MKITFTPTAIQASSRIVIRQAEEILETYAGRPVTLRQLYYQFVRRNWIPNNDKSYDRLGQIINIARLAGKLSWRAIIDRTRRLETHSSWETAEEMMNSAVQWHNIDKWVGQPVQPEVWIEKEALIGVIERKCSDLEVPYFACRGYTSQSSFFEASVRAMRREESTGQKTLILHFGDHDPSGVDMTDDITNRFDVFRTSRYVTVKRIALNMDQVKQYDPPPQPAKVSDSRHKKYVEQFGHYSWELDSLEPGVIDQLIEDNVKPLIDQTILAKRVKKQEFERARLVKARDWLQKGGGTPKPKSPRKPKPTA